jgi:hypothetical protein
MMPFSRYMAIALVLAMLGCNREPAATLTLRDEIYAATRDAESFEIYSLQPGVREGETLDSYPDVFHGWPQLGKAGISIESWKKPVLMGMHRALYTPSEPATCFNPRHGLRVIQNGKAMECVICFECHQMRVYREGQEDHEFLVIGSGQEEFDQVLRLAGAMLPDKNAFFVNVFDTAPAMPAVPGHSERSN